MIDLFSSLRLGPMELANHFVFPPIKTAYGRPSGEVTDQQILFYSRLAEQGPGLLILEPVSVTVDGREHPKQLAVHHETSASELKKIADAIHAKNRKGCLHINHAGGAANPKVTGRPPWSSSPFICARTGVTAEPLSPEGIEDIIEGFRQAARKAVEAGFDAIEIQAGHGYLLDQFLNPAINQRKDEYGSDRLLFARRVIQTVADAGQGLALLVRISGEGMAPGKSTPLADIDQVVAIARDAEFAAVHVGMGSNCFSPPWYFHHMSLPEEPQEKALARIKQNAGIPVIAAGRMGSLERARRIVQEGRADMIALGRPLIADPDLIAKWSGSDSRPVQPCGYCLQGCLVHVADGSGIGCNFNPELGRPAFEPSKRPLSVLVAGGGPAGLSAALYLAARGHEVTLAEQSKTLGGKALLAPLAPGKGPMEKAIAALALRAEKAGVRTLLGREVDKSLVEQIGMDLLVWAVGAGPNQPRIAGMEGVHVMSCLDYFTGGKQVRGERVLVIGAGRNGLEATERLGQEGFDVVATKRTDTLGSFMEPISKKLCLTRIKKMPNVKLMPLTTILGFATGGVRVRSGEEERELPSFDTVILCAGMVPGGGPPPEIAEKVDRSEVLGDALEVKDIYSAVHAGYEFALKI